MTLLDHMQAMARNNAWANARLLGACLALTDAEFAAHRTGFFPSLQRTLNHVLLVDRGYLSVMQTGVRDRIENWTPFPRAPDLLREQAATDRALIAFCDALDEAGLHRPVTIDRGDGRDHTDPVHAILAHLFQHDIHHRGQAHAMLSGTGVEPPQLDEFFLEMDAPARDAELRAIGVLPPLAPVLPSADTSLP